jgi:hypothetical protein
MVNVVDLAGTVPPSLCNVNEDIGQRVVTALGEPAARELLEVLERSDADRRR